MRCLLLLLACLPTPFLFAQPGGGIAASPSLGAPKAELDRPVPVGKDDMVSSFKREFYPVGRTVIRVPQDLPPQRALQADQLIRQLNAVCPACSNAGSIEGTPVTGTVGLSGGGAPLFGSSATNGEPTVTITRKRYQALLDKAELFDRLTFDGSIK